MYSQLSFVVEEKDGKPVILYAGDNLHDAEAVCEEAKMDPGKQRVLLYQNVSPRLDLYPAQDAARREQAAHDADQAELVAAQAEQAAAADEVAAAKSRMDAAQARLASVAPVLEKAVEVSEKRKEKASKKAS